MILVVGCPAEIVSACSEAGGRFAVGVQACDLGSMRTAASAGRPFAILVTEEVYQRDPDAVDRLAREGEAPLLRIDAENVRGHAPRLLADALFESAATTAASGLRPAIC